jgi:citrate lyase subunit beta/citryl-CoA lyase
MIRTADNARPRRSVLYTPAVNARAVAKARTLPCDVVVIDLEDSVGPETKAEARALAVQIVKDGGFGPRELAVRCNGLHTPWGVADLRAMTEAGAEIVVLPKIQGAQDLHSANAFSGGAVRLWAMIETATAVVGLPAIAGMAQMSRLEALMLGTNDLAADLHCRHTPGREALTMALQSTVVAARAFGLLAFDGTFNDLADLDGFAAQCRQGADLGFDGKTVIHPNQIEAANSAFSPTPDQLAWARKVIGAYAADPEAGVLKVDGQMVERLHLREARRLVALNPRSANRVGV